MIVFERAFSSCQHLATLHDVCTNTCDRSVCEFLSRIESIMGEADEKSRGELMARLKSAIDGCGISGLLEEIGSDDVGALAVHGYYRTLETDRAVS